MKLLISAAEISSDIQAEACIRALVDLLKAQGNSVEIAGIGGPRIRSLPHFQCIESAENLRVMGFVEVLGKISFIKKTQNRLIEFAKDFKPDLIITFDYPDFHLRLMERIHELPELGSSLKVCAIPPKVWVWRKNRVNKIRRIYDGVLVIFPFEKNFYTSHGIPVIYEGNPLAAQLPYAESALEAQSRLGCSEWIDQGYFPISVFPGSREGELKRHLPVIAPTLEKAAVKTGKKILALVPLAPGAGNDHVASAFTDTENVKYTVHQGMSSECLRASKVGLIKSGTSTLEAVLLGVFPVIFYKIHWLSEWIFRLVVRYSGPVGLPNVLLGIKKREDSIYPELLGGDANPENLSHALAEQMFASERPSSLQLENSKKLKAMLVPSLNVNQKIAEALRDWLSHPPAPSEMRSNRTPSPVLTVMVSWVWSCINFIRRRIVHLFGVQARLCIGPSVLIGNLQAGGSGKTPIVKALAKDAIQKGKTVAILTRGYKSKLAQETLILPHQAPVSAAQFGDEAAELQAALPQAVIGVGRDRVHAAKLILQWAQTANQKVDLVLLDDGFQNLKFKPDYTILCVTNRSRCEQVYRDFYSEIKFADLVLGTKGDALEYFQKKSSRFLNVEWSVADLPKLPLILLCALGDPREVTQFYQALGVKIQKVVALPDHERFEPDIVQKLQDEALTSCALLAATEKDFVKLKEMGFQEYTDNISTLSQPQATKIAVLRRSANVKELFKRALER